MSGLSNIGAFYQAQAEEIDRAFKNDEDEKVAAMCRDALADPRLPPLYRAQYEVFMASLDEDNAEARLRRALDMIKEMETMLKTDEKEDWRVGELRKQVDDWLAKLTQIPWEEVEVEVEDEAEGEVEGEAMEIEAIVPQSEATGAQPEVVGPLSEANGPQSGSSGEAFDSSQVERTSARSGLSSIRRSTRSQSPEKEKRRRSPGSSDEEQTKKKAKGEELAERDEEEGAEQ
ncbi:hypothetical protein LTS18_005775 [Coniosporium uncinatum]|uniref:Uncharacterized protein n=1 Tax=Coniosporium uncinatum TaxID=93489 RepID=A0ACC3D4I9_9PEZI|nr:hypothetical protein LTS18_005775 [Coniosporium uncinatum]